MADYTPHNAAGRNNFTMLAGATITGGQLLEITGVNTVSPTAAASGIVVGVAAHDAVLGESVTIWPLAGVVHWTVSNAGVTAADGVEAGSAGTAGSIETVAVSIAASAAAGTLLGTAIRTTGAGDPALWVSR